MRRKVPHEVVRRAPALAKRMLQQLREVAPAGGSGSCGGRRLRSFDVLSHCGLPALAGRPAVARETAAKRDGGMRTAARRARQRTIGTAGAHERQGTAPWV